MMYVSSAYLHIEFPSGDEVSGGDDIRGWSNDNNNKGEGKTSLPKQIDDAKLTTMQLKDSYVYAAPLVAYLYTCPEIRFLTSQYLTTSVQAITRLVEAGRWLADADRPSCAQTVVECKLYIAA